MKFMNIFAGCFVLALAACGQNFAADKEYLAGTWVEPVPGMENMVQGFSLEENGKASSVNMATLQYEKWQSSGKQLVLSGKSIGNHQAIDFTTTYEIKELSPQKLVLEKDNQVFTFHRQEN